MLLSVLPLLASALSAPIAADRLEEQLLGPCARGKRVDQPLTAPVEGFLTTTAMDHPQREKGATVPSIWSSTVKPRHGRCLPVSRLVMNRQGNR